MSGMQQSAVHSSCLAVASLFKAKHKCKILSVSIARAHVQDLVPAARATPEAGADFTGQCQRLGSALKRLEKLQLQRRSAADELALVGTRTSHQFSC
jgi:hypothetical protein